MKLDSHNRETIVASSFAILLLVVLSWPAFKYYFFSEAFWHLRLYELHGRNLWEAAFSPIGGMFFRPGLFLSDMLWDPVLPPDPLAYHLRNMFFCAVNIVLFYRVLLKFVASRAARIIALALLASSKMYMTIIGYINLYEASILLMTLLLIVMFWFRYIEKRRSIDYALTLICCIFAAYSKDNSFLIIGILAAMIFAIAIKPGDLRSEIPGWSVRFAPFVIISASSLVLRYVLIGPINPNNAVYSPRFSFSIALWQTKAFLATVGNLSLTNPDTMGGTGISGLFTANSRRFEFVICAALWVLILYLLWRSRSDWRTFIVPLVWIASYLFPLFLIRNHQVYYYQESLAGVALLVGLGLNGAKKRLLFSWIVVVALIAANGFISNRRSYYAWQYTANRAAEVVKPIVASRKENPPTSITFVSSPGSLEFWDFAIGGPMVPRLVGARDMKVSVIDSQSGISSGAEVHYLPK